MKLHSTDQGPTRTASGALEAQIQEIMPWKIERLHQRKRHRQIRAFLRLMPNTKSENWESS